MSSRCVYAGRFWRSIRWWESKGGEGMAQEKSDWGRGSERRLNERMT